MKIKKLKEQAPQASGNEASARKPEPAPVRSAPTERQAPKPETRKSENL